MGGERLVAGKVMRIVARISVLHIDDDGYAVGKAGRSEIEIPIDLFEKMAEEVEPGRKRSKKLDRDRIATGIEALVRAWIDVYRKGATICHYQWYKDLPIVAEFARHFSNSLRGQ
jgi:hypothetical protein